MSSRIAEVDITRAVAIIGVVVLHSTFQSRFGDNAMAVVSALGRLFDWAVLAFFFASGLLHDQGLPFAALLKKKFVSLLAPFFAYNAFYNICFAGIAAGGLHINDFNPGLRLLLTGLFKSPAFQLYFLPYLFCISIVVWTLNNLARRYRGPLDMGVILLVVAFYVVNGFPRFSYGSEYAKLPLYLGAYLVGLVGRPLFEKPCRVPGMLWVILCAVLCLLVLFRLTMLSLLVPPLLFCAAANSKCLREFRPFARLGRHSGSIYVWHTPLMLPCCTLLLARLHVPALLNFSLSLGLTLGACILLRGGVDAFFEGLLKMKSPRFITL